MAIQFFIFWLGCRLGPNLAELNGAGRGGSGPREKNPVSKWVGFGPRSKTCGSGPGMEKPGPNPTHCHSYYRCLNAKKCVKQTLPKAKIAESLHATKKQLS